MTSAVVIEAPAKLTVSLRVTGVRDDGFHLLDAEMVTIDLADTLTFDDGDALEIVGFDVAADDSNLVRRALALIDRSAYVRVEKRILPGAGLGGGSADAAAVLRWAGVDDVELAARLGADVPFCLRGGRARVTGVGEHVDPLPFEARVLHPGDPAIRMLDDRRLSGVGRPRGAPRARQQRPRVGCAARGAATCRVAGPTCGRNWAATALGGQRIDVVRRRRLPGRRPNRRENY